MENQFNELRRAKEIEEEAKKIVLKLLHTNGIIAFDASSCILDKEVEALIKGEG